MLCRRGSSIVRTVMAILAILLVTLRSGIVCAQAAITWYLGGGSPMSSATCGCAPSGPHYNHTAIFPFNGVNTTYVNIEYLGGFTVHAATYSEVQNEAVSLGQLMEATGSISISPTGRMSGPGPYPQTLTGGGKLTAVITVGTNSFHDGSVNFLGTRIDSLGALYFTDPGTYTISIPLTSTTVPVASDGTFPLTMELRSESQSRVGTTSGNFSHTLALTSLLLPNGHTPESEGWTLSFDNGSSSPNRPQPVRVGGWNTGRGGDSGIVNGLNYNDIRNDFSGYFPSRPRSLTQT